MPQILSTYHVNVLGTGDTVDFIALTRDAQGQLALYPCDRTGNIIPGAHPLRTDTIDINGDRQPDKIDLQKSAQINKLVSVSHTDTVFMNQYEMYDYDPGGAIDVNRDGQTDLVTFDIEDYRQDRYGYTAHISITTHLTPTWVAPKH